MRTNIEIDDDLIGEVMTLGGYPTKRAAVDAALRKLLDIQRQRGILALRGAVDWQGDLDAMRRGWAPPTETWTPKLDGSDAGGGEG